MPGLSVSSIPQCKYNRHEGGCRESFQATGRFQPRLIEARRASLMISKVRSLSSRIRTCSFVEEITISSTELFKDLPSNMPVRIRQLGNSTRKIAESYVTSQQTAGWCQQRVPVSRLGSSLWAEIWFRLVPDPDQNPTHFVLAVMSAFPEIYPLIFNQVGTGPRF